MLGESDEVTVCLSSSRNSLNIRRQASQQLKKLLGCWETSLNLPIDTDRAHDETGGRCAGGHDEGRREGRCEGGHDEGGRGVGRCAGSHDEGGRGVGRCEGGHDEGGRGGGRCSGGHDEGGRGGGRCSGGHDEGGRRVGRCAGGRDEGGRGGRGSHIRRPRYACVQRVKFARSLKLMAPLTSIHALD
ncbi:hypothetical protein FHG87_013764 [Trinorchestia longiramus]|nr:hypothetical protein FHG87_013764 [Trinorchestia longiramus]